MQIEAEKYRPSEDGKSDKFSWNLYRVFKRYAHLAVEFKVLQVGWNGIHGVCEPEEGDQYLIIDSGEPFPIVGHLPQIMTRANKAMFSPGFFSGVCWGDIEKLDITTQWFSDYETKGRCIVVGSWSHDWRYESDDLRTCLHCGKQERRTIEMLPRETWSEAA